MIHSCVIVACPVLTVYLLVPQYAYYFNYSSNFITLFCLFVVLLSSSCLSAKKSEDDDFSDTRRLIYT